MEGNADLTDRPDKFGEWQQKRTDGDLLSYFIIITRCVEGAALWGAWPAALLGATYTVTIKFVLGQVRNVMYIHAIPIYIIWALGNTIEPKTNPDRYDSVDRA